MDEIASPADADNADASTAGSAKGPVRAYHEAVLTQRQPKVTDLLPVRPLWIVVLLLIGLTGVAAIEAIHVHAATLKLPNGAAHLAALNANERGSLAAWYASALLAAGAALAIVVFGIRSHRVDDYRGRYRIWLWTAVALTWLSLDAATNIHDAIGLGLTLVVGKQVVGSTLAAACTLTWIAVYGLVFGSLALRLAFEVGSSRLSLLALFVAGGLYVAAALFQLEMLTSPETLIDGTAESTLILVAHLSLLTAIGLYARHVLLDAGGRLKVHIDPDRKNKSRRGKLKVVNASKPRPVVAGTSVNESAKGSSAPAAASAVAKPGVSITKNALTSPAEEDDDDEEDEAYAGLSRSERRRLKKLARREQRRAA